jgi:CelD/BcsL family acetyltransferase involved in cellulose biosynthesis
MQAICEEAGTGAKTVAASELHGEWIAAAADFARLEPEWCDLFQRANPGNIFLSFGWMSTWWKHFGKGQLAVNAIRDEGGRLVAVAPFYISRSVAGMGARRLGFLADDHVGSDYLGVLADARCGTAAVEEIARILFAHRRLWDYIELRDSMDSPLMAALSAALVRRGTRVFEAGRRVCRYILLPATFDSYLAGIGGSLRANYRRRWRALQREHQAECLAVSSAAELERLFPALIALHRMRFNQRNAESAFLAPGVPEFHAEAMRVLAAQGFVRLFLLKAAGDAVAALYGFSVSGTFQFYQCGMDPDWMRYGLGQVLIGNAIEQAVAAGHATFDFLRGDESYKSGWADRSRQNVTVRFFDRRAASLAARLGLQVSAGVRRAVRRSATLLSAALPEKLRAWPRPRSIRT